MAWPRRPRTYFDKPLDELSIAQAAYPRPRCPKAPNNYNPFRCPEAALARRNWVIDRMADDHAITPEQAAAAKAEPWCRRPPAARDGRRAPS